MYIHSIYVKEGVLVGNKKKHSLLVCENCLKPIQNYRLISGWEGGRCDICRTKYSPPVSPNWRYWKQLSNEEKKEIICDYPDHDKAELRKMHWRKLLKEHPLVKLGHTVWLGRIVSGVTWVGKIRTGEPQRWLKDLNYKVYPRHVRQNVKKYDSTVAAWPGIILESHCYRHRNETIVDLQLEHRYAWGGDFSIQPKEIVLSTRGEGWFRTLWYPTSDINYTDIDKCSNPGNLVIVYGIPTRVVDHGTIVMKCLHVEFIDKETHNIEIKNLMIE